MIFFYDSKFTPKTMALAVRRENVSYFNHDIIVFMRHYLVYFVNRTYPILSFI